MVNGVNLLMSIFHINYVAYDSQPVFMHTINTGNNNKKIIRFYISPKQDYTESVWHLGQ